MNIINEEIIDIVHIYFEAHKNRNLETLVSTIHSEDMDRAKKFVEENYNLSELNDFVFSEVDRRLEGIPKDTSIVSTIRTNEFGTEFIYLTDSKNEGLYTSPTKFLSWQIPIKKDNGRYKIKLYED